MGLFDIFSGDAARKAAEVKAAGQRQGYADLSSLYGQGREALGSAYDQAQQPLQTVFGESAGGSQAYADASGANGPEGLARARDAYMSGQLGTNAKSQVGFGIDALTRAGAAKGIATGNTLRDAEDYGQKVYGQGYGQYTAGLSPYLGMRSGAAGGLASLGARRGDALAGSFEGQGVGAYKAATGEADARAAGEMADYNASGNLWGALLQGGKLGLGAYGSGMLGSPGGYDPRNPGAGAPRQGTGLFSMFG